MTSTATQAFAQTTEAMISLSKAKMNTLRNEAEVLYQEAMKFQADLDMRVRWISSVKETINQEESPETKETERLLGDFDAFAKYCEDVKEVIEQYDSWLGRLQNF